MTAERRFTVIVCRGPTCGDVRRSGVLYERLEESVVERGLAPRITLLRETCFGHCQRGPNILVYDTDEMAATGALPGPGAPAAVLYNRMTPSDLERVIERHLVGGAVVWPLLNRPPVRD